MNIRRKITLIYSLIVGTILILSGVYIYSLSKNYSRQLFFTRLKERAFVTANIYFEKDELNPKLYENIQKEFLHSLEKEDIQIYDHENQSLTGEKSENAVIQASMIEKIRKEKYFEFEDGQRQSVGIYYEDNQGNFVIITSAVDAQGIEKINYLKKVLVINFFLTIIIVVITGRLIANQLLNPLKEMIDKVNEIRAGNLHLRLKETVNKDELNALGVTFNQMLLRLEKTFETQRQFIHYASHELKTPLTSIIGKVDVVLNKARTENEYKEALNVILFEAERLNKLTNGLLALSRSDFEGEKISTKQVEIKELLKTAITDIHSHIPQSRIDLKVGSQESPSESWTMNANESMLYSAFYNCIENAVKFSDKKTVEVEIENRQNCFTIRISDKGIGMDAKDLENIFKPFYRNPSAMKYPGSGLGLSITKNVITQHKGTIDVDSRTGEGTTVTIRLSSDQTS
jgi:two-component system sensor histidine kinase ArlS